MAKSNISKQAEAVAKPTAEELPVYTALSLVQVKDGWSVLTLKIQGDKVIDVKATPADMRAIAIESIRISVTKEFIWTS